MTVEATIVEQIEALSRSEFRASVNAERRATLAIGALVLHWGQFDSSLGSMIQWMRETHEALGLGGLPGSILAASMTDLRYCANSLKHAAAMLRIWQNSINCAEDFLEIRTFAMILCTGQYPSPTK